MGRVVDDLEMLFRKHGIDIRTTKNVRDAVLSVGECNIRNALENREHPYLDIVTDLLIVEQNDSASRELLRDVWKRKSDLTDAIQSAAQTLASVVSLSCNSSANHWTKWYR